MCDTETFRLDMTMMFAIHDALRRELHHIARLTADATDAIGILEGAAGWQMLRTYLHVHHTCEDDVLWPAVRQHLADRPGELVLVAALEAEHAAIDPLLDAVDTALADKDGGGDRLKTLSGELATALTTHLSHEETEGLALIDASLTEQEWGRFGNEHGRRIGPEAPRYLPWLLEGLDEDRADRILENIPEPLRLAYREQWRPAFAQCDRWHPRPHNRVPDVIPALSTHPAVPRTSDRPPPLTER